MRQSVYLVSIIFFFELLFARIQRGDLSDQLIIAITLVRLLFICLTMLSILNNYYRKPLTKVVIKKQNRTILILFFIFFSISIFSGLIGYVKGHDIKFVIGDIIKFSIIPLFAITFSTLIKTKQQYLLLSKIIVTIYFIFLIKDIFLYITIYGVHVRPISIFLFPFMPLLVIFLHGENSAGIWFKLILIFYIISFPILVWFSQSLRLVFQTLFLTGCSCFIYIMLRRKIALHRIIILSIVICLSLVVTISIAYQFSIFNFLLSSEWYLTRKIIFMMKHGFTLKMIELIGGDRIAHAFAVIRYYSQEPLSLIIGQGMGGVIEVKSITGLLNRTWKPINHFIEGGYSEVFLRTGIIGILSYFFILFKLVIRSLKSSANSFIGALSASYFTYLFIFSFYGQDIVNEGFGSAFIFSMCFAGILIWSNHDYSIKTNEPIKIQSIKIILRNP